MKLVFEAGSRQSQRERKRKREVGSPEKASDRTARLGPLDR